MRTEEEEEDEEEKLCILVVEFITINYNIHTGNDDCGNNNQL